MNVGARRHMHALEPGGVAVAAAAVAAAAGGAPTKFVMAGAPANTPRRQRAGGLARSFAGEWEGPHVDVLRCDPRPGRMGRLRKEREGCKEDAGDGG